MDTNASNRGEGGRESEEDGLNASHEEHMTRRQELKYRT